MSKRASTAGDADAPADKKSKADSAEDSLSANDEADANAETAVPISEVLRAKVVADLHSMAEALAGTRDDAALKAAEARARESLIARIKELPPRAVVSKEALAAFKQQHTEMMAFIESASNSGGL